MKSSAKPFFNALHNPSLDHQGANSFPILKGEEQNQSIDEVVWFCMKTPQPSRTGNPIFHHSILMFILSCTKPTARLFSILDPSPLLFTQNLHHCLLLVRRVAYVIASVHSNPLRCLDIAFAAPPFQCITVANTGITWERIHLPIMNATSLPQENKHDRLFSERNRG